MTFIESVLPSGRGIRIERLNTRQFRAAQERVASKLGEGTATKLSMALGHEMLMAAFRGITAEPLAWVGPPENPDIDKMLESCPNEAWVLPTYEELIIVDGSRSLENLLDDVSDYAAAVSLVQDVTLPNRGRAGSIAGKTRMVSAAP